MLGQLPPGRCEELDDGRMVFGAQAARVEEFIKATAVPPKHDKPMTRAERNRRDAAAFSVLEELGNDLDPKRRIEAARKAAYPELYLRPRTPFKGKGPV